jgi:hypothetical protein
MSRLTVLVLAAAGLLAGQTFDAASVKSAGRGVCCQLKGGPGTSDPGRISYNHNLKYIIMKAWDVPVDQLAGPAWLMDTSGENYMRSPRPCLPIQPGNSFKRCCRIS